MNRAPLLSGGLPPPEPLDPDVALAVWAMLGAMPRVLGAGVRLLERLLLRPFVAADRDALARLYGDDVVMRYMLQGRGLAPAAAQERAKSNIHNFNDHWSRRGHGVWAVADRASGRLLGQCGLRWIPEAEATELLYLFAKTVWGRGLATEAGRAAVGFAFCQTALTALIAVTDPQNTATTGQAMAAYLLGLPNNALRNIGDTAAIMRKHDYSGFAQDDWQVTSRLTLNLGVRYDYLGWPVSRDNTLGESCFHKGDVRRRRSRHVDGERKTSAFCHGHDLRTLAPLGRAHPAPPFWATTQVLSMKHAERSHAPRSRRSVAKACRSRSKTPERTQDWKRRGQVCYGG